MAIFSRRTLQRLIDENADFLTKTQTQKHVDSLNLSKKIHLKLLESNMNINDLSEIYLNTEWEIAVLNCLSKFGEIIHEKRIGASEPDIFFTSDDESINFVADITCITGKQDKDNISLIFKHELKAIIDKEKLDGYWEIWVNGNSREMDFLNAKPRLMLGGKSHREEILNSKKFISFIERIKNNPERKHSFEYKKTSESFEPRPPNQIEMFRNVLIDIRIDYEPTKFYQIEYKHFNDRQIVKSENDEIYKSLLKKYNQLIKTNYNGFLGVFLCDGIGNTFNRADSLHKTPRDVIYNFLYKYPKIDFVITINSEIKPYNFHSSKPEIKATLFHGYGKKLDEKIIQVLDNSFAKIFPKPSRAVTNARIALKNSFEDKETMVSDGGCGSVFSYNKIKVSSRMLLELLSGKLKLDDFFYYAGIERISGSIPNLFLTSLNEGKLFSDVRIESGNEKDDDWIVFTFGESDSAISPFKIPVKYK
jgi:hypothetical protein